MIGKRGLSYRGQSQNETAYTLLNENIGHGNFLENVLLISKFDSMLRHHVEEITKESNRRAIKPALVMQKREVIWSLFYQNQLSV